MQNRYSKFLTVLLIIIIVIVLGLLGYLAYDYLSNYFARKDAEEAVERFEQEVMQNVTNEEQIENTQVIENVQEPEEQTQQNTQTSTSGNKTSTVTYKGYNMVGTIQIPKTNIKCPIVDKVTPTSITSAVGILYGPGLNQVGNTVIVGHNYRNGTFFSNNKKLAVGDKIYITDATGQKVEYTIYNTYVTSDEDFDYAVRDTAGKREISLSTCTEDVTKRLVIWAKAQ